MSLWSLESAPNELPDFLVFAKVLVLCSFLTISPVLVWSALFIIHHFLSIWPLKFTSYRKPGFVHHYYDIIMIKCEHPLSTVIPIFSPRVCEKWRNIIAWKKINHLNDRRHNYEPRGKGFLFND